MTERDELIERVEAAIREAYVASGGIESEAALSDVSIAAISAVRSFDCERGPSEAEIDLAFGWITEDPSAGYVDVDDVRIYRAEIESGLRDAAIERKRQWKEGDDDAN